MRFFFFSWINMIRVMFWQNQIPSFMLLLLSYANRVLAAASSVREHEPPSCKHVDFFPTLDFYRLWMWKDCLRSALSYKLLPKDSVLAGHEGSYRHSPTFFALYSSSGSDIFQAWWRHVERKERRNPFFSVPLLPLACCLQPIRVALLTLWLKGRVWLPRRAVILPAPRAESAKTNTGL